MRLITSEEWMSKKKMGYTSIIGDVRHVLTMGQHGTTLEPVQLIRKKRR